MPDRDTYFLTRADLGDMLRAVPSTFSDSRITPLIGARAYFDELIEALSHIGQGATPRENAGQFIYIMNWTIGLGDEATRGGPGGPFSLHGRGRTPLFRNILLQKAQRGVDVRVLGWVSPCVLGGRAFIVDPEDIIERYAPYLIEWNRMTFESIRLLREESSTISDRALRVKACLILSAHPRGSAHAKVVIIHGNRGDYIAGFTGGLDFESKKHPWHDVVAKVEGPAVQGLYDYFRGVWNAIAEGSASPITIRTGRYSLQNVVRDTPLVDPVCPDLCSTGSHHHVQSLRTVPCFPRIRPPFPGVFEIRAAYEKAIHAATRYIYVENSTLWSIEVMGWLRTAISNNADLYVILMISGDRTPYKLRAVHTLLSDLPSDQRSRVEVFTRSGTAIHSKTILVDDQWAVVGSANINVRGLYTDFENSVSMFDDDNSLVRDYRVRLWSAHFLDGRRVEDLEHALNVWNDAWGRPGSGVSLLPQVSQYAVPSTSPDIPDYRYENFEDPDSRQVASECLSRDWVRLLLG